VRRPGAVAAFDSSSACAACSRLIRRGALALERAARVLLSSVLLLGPLARAASWLAHSLRVLAASSAPSSVLGGGAARARRAFVVARAQCRRVFVCGGARRRVRGALVLDLLRLVALQIALALLSEQGELRAPCVSRPDPRAHARARIVVGCAFALCGTRSLDGMSKAGPWPWQWALVQKPALLSRSAVLSFAGQLGFSSSC